MDYVPNIKDMYYNNNLIYTRVSDGGQNVDMPLVLRLRPDFKNGDEYMATKGAAQKLCEEWSKIFLLERIYGVCMNDIDTEEEYLVHIGRIYDKNKSGRFVFQSFVVRRLSFSPTFPRRPNSLKMKREKPMMKIKNKKILKDPKMYAFPLPSLSNSNNGENLLRDFLNIRLWSTGNDDDSNNN